MDHVGEIAAAREVEQIEQEEEGGVLHRPLREQAVPEPEGERDPLGDQDLEMGELAIAERGERVHPPGQRRRDPRDSAAAEYPADRQGAGHERGEEQEVVAGDGVGDELQEQEQLRRRPQEVIGERQGAPRGVVDVGVPHVRQPEPDLMGPPLEHVEDEQGISEIRPDVVPREARQRPEVDEGAGGVESGKRQPREEAAGGGGRGHGAGLYSAARGSIPGRAYIAAPFPELPFCPPCRLRRSSERRVSALGSIGSVVARAPVMSLSLPERSRASRFSTRLPPPLPSPLVIWIFGTTSAWDFSIASAKRLITCCTSWNCGPP